MMFMDEEPIEEQEIVRPKLGQGRPTNHDVYEKKKCVACSDKDKKKGK